jgi:menaquinone-9 beta-reductase
VHGLRIIAPNRTVSEMFCKHPEPIFLTGKRFHFDKFLFDHLDPNYADIRLGATVTHLERKNDGIEITYTQNGEKHTVFTKMLLGADGDHSVVQRKLDARKIDRRFYAAALRVYTKNVADMHPKGLLEVYFPKQYPFSYFWVFPLPNNECNVGYGMASHQISKDKINLNDVLDNIVTNDPAMKHRFAGAEFLEKPRGWGLPLASRRRECLGDNYLLLGDAASLIHPLSGEGIGSAMLSGMTAAVFVEHAIKQNKFDQQTLKQYQHEASKRLEAEIKTYHIAIKLAPEYWQHLFFNAMITSGYAKYSFEKNAMNWMDTLYNKPVIVDLGIS